MVEDPWPTWLKVMENGSVGEARSRAFLIDRFWVLERSVDTEGADFLIQRRTVTQRFTDKVPPRVGVVQAKYFQDRRTTHHIPKSYVVDDAGVPLEGFFALLHVGREDDGEMHLLSAREIVETMAISAAHTPESYIVGTTALSGNYRVGSRRLALDKIEHSLKSQTYLQSAAFYDQLNIPFRRFGEEDIDFHWTLPLPNPVGEIPKMYFQGKESLRKIVFNMDEVLGIIDAILTEKDPRKAMSLMEDLRMHVDGHGQISFSTGRDFGFGDLDSALDTHERWRSSLEADGLLATYVAMGDRLERALAERAKSHPLTEKGDFLEANLEFDPDTLVVKSLTASSGKTEDRQPAIVEQGRVRESRRLDDWAPRKTSPIGYTIENLWWAVMMHVIEERYPEQELESVHSAETETR